jgi:hypothetical protein
VFYYFLVKFNAGNNNCFTFIYLTNTYEEDFTVEHSIALGIW